MNRRDRMVDEAAWTGSKITAGAVGKCIVSGQVTPGRVLRAVNILNDLTEEFRVSRRAIRETMRISAPRGWPMRARAALPAPSGTARGGAVSGIGKGGKAWPDRM